MAEVEEQVGCTFVFQFLGEIDWTSSRDRRRGMSQSRVPKSVPQRARKVLGALSGVSGVELALEKWAFYR